ncbi:DnaA-like protein [Rhizobium sp. PP-F2F-G36]|nr:DnaA-like protein [Rhizobium sp. PP-F2F-G36]
MTMPPAHADSALTTMGPMGLLGRFSDDLRLATTPFSVRAASYGLAAPSHTPRHTLGHHAPGRAPECKSVWPPSAAPATSRVSELPDTAAPDPLAQARCRMVADVVEELTMMVGDRQQLRRDRRRMMTHVRQIAMYVSHVVLQVSLTDISVAFGRDRSTVSYSCHVVEDRRDDADFDAFVSAIERVITAVFPPAGDAAHA